MKTIITHSGAFHADEVFAVSVLLLSLPGDSAKVVRTRDEQAISAGDHVIDVGWVYDPSIGRFDHHQPGGAGNHDNGIPYASFGLLWKEYGLLLCKGNEEAWRHLENKIVCPIDAIDNGVALATNLHKDVYSYSIQDVLATYHGGFESAKEENDAAFFQAVDFSMNLLKREIKKALEYQTLQKVVEDMYAGAEEKTIITLPGKYPWVETMMSHPEPIFVIYPDRENDTWVAKGVPAAKHSFDRRKLFPLAWAGKKTDMLRSVSGVEDAIFCHSGRFIAVAKSKEGARALAEKALANSS